MTELECVLDSKYGLKFEDGFEKVKSYLRCGFHDGKDNLGVCLRISKLMIGYVSGNAVCESELKKLGAKFWGYKFQDEFRKMKVEIPGVTVVVRKDPFLQYDENVVEWS